jgi:hypothetical protein
MAAGEIAAGFGPYLVYWWGIVAPYSFGTNPPKAPSPEIVYVPLSMFYLSTYLTTFWTLIVTSAGFVGVLLRALGSVVRPLGIVFQNDREPFLFYGLVAAVGMSVLVVIYHGGLVIALLFGR